MASPFHTLRLFMDVDRLCAMTSSVCIIGVSLEGIAYIFTVIYLSMKPDNKHKLVKLQECLKDINAWMTKFSASKLR